MFSLRDIRWEDKDMVRAWRNHPEVSKYMYTDHEITAEEHELWLNRALQHLNGRYWIMQCDGQDVGFLGVFNIDEHNRRCYWMFYTNPGIRGKGIGSFAEYSVLRHVFDELKMNKLCGEVLGFNMAVVEMHERFGFVREGFLRRHIFKGGQWHDVVSIGMLREEWENRKSEIEARLREKGIIPQESLA